MSVLKRKIVNDNSFSNDLEKAVDAITFDKNNVVFAGSGFLKSMRYSADVDLAEYFDSRYSANDVAHAVQTIVKKIQKQEGCYIGNIKSGLDEQLNVFTHLGYLKNSVVHDYDRSETNKDIKSVKSLIEPEDYQLLLKLNSTPDSISAWFDLRDTIRSLFTLRWNAAEVLQGFKTVRNENIPLSVAVTQFLTKIDMWFSYDGIFTEITNVLVSSVPPWGDNALIFLPICPNEKCFDDAIKYNLFEFLNHDNKNYLKFTKRLFSLARQNDDTVLVNKIVPLLTSNVGLLNKVVSIMQTLCDMIEFLNNPPLKAIKRNIDELKTMLSNIYEFDFGEQQVDKELTKLTNSRSKQRIYSGLENLIERLTVIINEQSLQYINANHLLPVPKKYLP